jgi:hypothetical protein
MNRVFVLDSNKQPLAPCTPARARQLMDNNKAAAYRYNPFTIILHRTVELDAQDNYSINLDPGAVTTGLAIIGHFPKQGDVVIFGAEITHKSTAIKAKLYKRSGFRSKRRSRLRYRPARFNNRTRKEGWLAPSLESRVNCITHFVNKFNKLLSNANMCNIELPKFDTQKMNNPNIKNYQYSQGVMSNFDNTKDYLIHRDGESCFYCGTTDKKLFKEHVAPRATGSNSVNNLVLSCQDCNNKKSNKPVDEFLTDAPEVLTKLKRRNVPQWAAAAMNSMRNRLIQDITKLNIEIGIYTGWQTSYNRNMLGYPKEHWIDAACVGDNVQVHITNNMIPLKIKAIGKGSRRVINNDKYGFPRINKKTGDRQATGNIKRIQGFSTGDLVHLVATGKKYAGEYRGRLSGIRKTGYLSISLNPPLSYMRNGESKDKKDLDNNYKNFKLIQHGDSYEYHSCLDGF